MSSTTNLSIHKPSVDPKMDEMCILPFYHRAPCSPTPSHPAGYVNLKTPSSRTPFNRRTRMAQPCLPMVSHHYALSAEMTSPLITIVAVPNGGPAPAFNAQPQVQAIRDVRQCLRYVLGCHFSHVRMADSCRVGTLSQGPQPPAPTRRSFL
jgi:hypothetical protein